jgi:hypothetical protein
MRVKYQSVSRLALVAVAGVLGGGVSAQAADLGGDCCADLEERVAELEATTVRKGNRKVSLELSGWVSQQVMFWDDGKESNVYVGNNNATASRFRFVGRARINPTWSAGYLMEFGVHSGGSSITMSQGPAVADDTPGTGFPAAVAFFQLRHSAWWIDHKDYGRLWVGQTGQATDAIANINLANTAVAGAHAKTTQNDGAMRLRTVAPINLLSGNPVGMSNATWGALRNSGHGNPGDGDRLQVVKYVSPALMGFIFSAAWGEDDMWDVALRYAGEFGGFKIAAGIGYQQLTDGNADGGNGILGCSNARANMTAANRPIGSSDVDCWGVAGSASIMHVPTGIYVTGAAGQQSDNNRTVTAFAVGVAQNIQSTDSFWYVQAGIEQNWFGIGKTTLYGEYHSVNAGTINASIPAAGAVAVLDPINSLGAAAYIHGAHVNTWGFGMVQAIDAAAMDLFINYRTREADVTLGRRTDGTLRRSNAIEDLQIITVGGMIKF